MPNQQHFLAFSKPFITAAKNVFETMVFTKLQPDKPTIKEGNQSKGDVSAVLGITGTIKREGKDDVCYKGMLVLSWPYETYLKIAGAMLMEEFSEFNEEIADVGGEICNMIMGNAKRDLNGLGYTTDMAIPSMIEGPGHNIKYLQGTTVVLIPMKTDHGDFFMELCYQET